MTDRELLLDLMDRAVRDVTLRMTGIRLVRVVSCPAHAGEGDHPLLSVEIKGDDGFVLFYNAEEHLLRAIAQKMKRRPVDNLEEAVEYDKEYFNIICGQAISAFNRMKKTSLRFGVPRCRAAGEEAPRPDSLVLYYQSREGSASMKGRCPKRYEWEGA